uniref:Uncharacterized protein n=1 Tax=Manihot esculenta TaxID=3983 RepID=A0A2C9VJC0_MANES
MEFRCLNEPGITLNAIKAKKLFHFDSRWVENLETQQIINDAWNEPVHGSHLSQAFRKLKKCRHSLEQKARIQWLKYGDRNIGYFHAKVIQRRKRNHIMGLKDNQGRWKTSLEDLKNIVCQHF